MNQYFIQNGDDGISREELTTVLTSALQSAEMVLSGAAGQEFRDRKPSQTGEALIVSVTVDKLVLVWILSFMHARNLFCWNIIVYKAILAWSIAYLYYI